MINNQDVSLPLRRAGDTKPQKCLTTCVRIQHVQLVPEQSEVEVMVYMDDSITGGEWIIKPESQKSASALVARAVWFTPKQGQFPVRILNLGNDRVNLHRGMRLAFAEEMNRNNANIAAISQAEGTPKATETQDLLNTLWEMVDGNDNMSASDKNKLYHLLVTYKDVFAKTKLILVEPVKHNTRYTLHLYTRRIAPAQREETTKLLQDMFSKKVIQFNHPLVHGHHL